MVTEGRKTMSKKLALTKWEGMFEEDVPMSKQLKPNEFLVLHVIAMTQGAGGYSDITQKQMLESLPIGSNKTLQTAIDGLVEFRYKGKPVIEKTKKKGVNGKEQNVYRLLPNPLFAVYGERPMEKKEESLSVNSTLHNEPLSVNITHTKEQKITKEKELKNIKEEQDMTREMSPKEVVTLFVEAMKETNREYKVVWGRDMKLAKSFLSTVEDLKNNEKKEVIKHVVENYEKWSTNSAKYPLQISTLKIEWIQSKARDLMKEEKNKVSQIENQSVVAEERQDKAIQSIMSRIKKKGGQ
jgi:hypothetical protein